MSQAVTAGRREPASCTPDHSFGGQAVIEGVMMRGRNSWGLAVRRPSGEIARVAYPLAPPGSRHKLLRLPVVRGVLALYDSMALGIRALGISANIGLEEVPAENEAGSPERTGAEFAATVPAGMAPLTLAAAADARAVDGDAPDAVPAEAIGLDAREERASQVHPAMIPASEGGAEQPFGWKQLAVTVLVALALAIGLFVVIPLVVVKLFEDTFANPFVFNLVEGVIRIAIFILYIAGISLIPDLRRVFMYHGAEHKVIHAYEACGRPDAGEAEKYSTLHPRCGTGFLLIVMVLAVFLFAILGKPSLPLLVLSRIIGIPVIVGIAYEVGIRGLGRHPDWLVSRFFLWPGLQLQRLTTRQPTPDQLEIAAAALEEVIAMDRAEQQTGAPVPATVSI